MAPVFDFSCRKRENDSVFSGVLSSVIVTSKHSLCGPAVVDPGLVGNSKEVESNPVKSLPAPNQCI